MPIIEAKNLNTPNEYCILTTDARPFQEGAHEVEGQDFFGGGVRPAHGSSEGKRIL